VTRIIFQTFALLLATAAPVWAQEAPQNFALYDAPKPLPDIRFSDAGGKQFGLADFRGKVVLLNIWATWCVPCRTEMPTLDRLQARLGGADFEVVPLSIDRQGVSAIDDFYRKVGIVHLGKYLDADGESADHLQMMGVPATLLINRQGRELGRLVGPAEWDSPEMIAILARIMAREPAP